MTIEQRMNSFLLEHGMYPREERDAVIALAKEHFIGMVIGWSEDVADTANLDPLWRDVKRIARGYLAENNPTATYRSFFE